MTTASLGQHPGLNSGHALPRSMLMINICILSAALSVVAERPGPGSNVLWFSRPTKLDSVVCDERHESRAGLDFSEKAASASKTLKKGGRFRKVQTAHRQRSLQSGHLTLPKFNWASFGW